MANESWTVTAETRLAAEVRARLSLSHRKAQNLIDRGAVRVAGAVVTDHGATLTVGMQIEVRTDAPRRHAPPGSSLAEILFEDRHVIVVAKPAGVLTVPRDEQISLPPARRDPSLEDWLRDRDIARGARPSVYVVQRLDRGTSGVLVFPRNRQAYDTLKPAFARHEIERLYRAIVVGAPAKDEGTLRHKLVEKHGKVFRAHPTEPGGKDAVTHYSVIERRNGHALLDLTLETGRRNQIRVGCALEGYPILGDIAYGEAAAAIARPALHARALGFVHPHTEERLSFTMEEPADFQRAWERLGRGGSAEKSD